MKLKNFKIKKYSLLKLYLLKYQAYKVNFKNFTAETIDSIELCLKQSLKLIYLYHSNNQRILFIGFPYTKNKLVLKDSQHYFLQKEIWVPGLFGNNPASNKKVFLPTKNFDLVVLFNASSTDLVLLEELSSLRYPLIVIGSQISLKSVNTIYTVPVYALKKKIKQLCAFLIYSILKNSPKRYNLSKLIFKLDKKFS